MKVYLNTNVLQETKERLRFLFNEFDIVTIWVSGGKDSTIIYNLALEIARELNKLPLKCCFIDQEAEWEATIDMIRSIREEPDVEFYWYQMPILLFNATSTEQQWLECWKEGDEWLRPKEEGSISVNDYGTNRFHHLFEAICKKDFQKGDTNVKVAMISGVRADESQARYLAVTTSLTYKHITWGKSFPTPNIITFYPIYDWTNNDIWKAIHDHNWEYNKVYDYQYRHGVSVTNMRVSNLHHETAVHALFYLQEVEPRTYEALTKRLSGISTAGHLSKDDYFISKLPFMFPNWETYRDFLIDKLVKPHQQNIFINAFARQKLLFDHLPKYDNIVKAQINCILANDIDLTKVKNIERAYTNQETRDARDRKIAEKTRQNKNIS